MDSSLFSKEFYPGIDTTVTVYMPADRVAA
jgi:hypothetical protein